MSKKAYISAFGFVYVAFSLTVIITSLWIQPFEGDLTRTGREPENRFGWNKAIKLFPKDHSTYYELTGLDYEGKQDYVVFGDSFSHMSMIGKTRAYGWQNFIYSDAKKSAYVYHLLKTPIHEWLEKTPADALPDHIVFQQVERSLKLHNLPNSQCTLENKNLATRGNYSIPFPGNMIRYERDIGSTLEIDAALHWIRGKFNPKQKALTFPLKRSDIFTSNDRQNILILPDDIRQNKRLTEEKIDQIACYLSELKTRTEANGRTRFIVAIVPDKFTVYAPYIDTDVTSINLSKELEDRGLSLYRLDILFREAIEAGAKDLYLPNDTHWNPEGSRLFASAILNQMQP